MKTITKIYYPETKIFGIIKSLNKPTKFGDIFESKIFGCYNYHKTFKDAMKAILDKLNYEASGQRNIDIANDARCARSEQIACGNQ